MRRPPTWLEQTGGLVALALLAAVALGAASESPFAKPVRVTGGLVLGVPGRLPSVTVFKGIPFAAPPVGELRWRAPMPPAAWTGVKRADTFSPSCVQTIVTERKPWTHEFMAHGAISEDCLYVNVWTPARGASERRAVFVYIYGGGNTEGSASVAVYDGEGLASKGLVVVTLNYRVGILGFYAHPALTAETPYHASGNYGLLDQLAALRWVHENIAAFGGDPARVTVAGQSAGASAVHNLTVSPLAKGLMARVIAESGSSLASLNAGRSLASEETDGVRFAEAKGAASLADLRAMPWEKIVAPVQPNATDGNGRGTTAPPRFGLVIDGYALPASEAEVFLSGHENDVATLTGSNADENGAVPHPTTTLVAYRAAATAHYGTAANEFLALYPAASDQAAGAAMNESARDQARMSTYLWARARAKTAKTNAYTYYWDRPLPGPDADQYGAFHTSEVPYALNTLAMSDRPFIPADRRIAATVSSYWTRFAETGDPNGPGLAHWPAVTAASAATMEIGEAFRPIPAAGSPAKIQFWTKVLTH